MNIPTTTSSTILTFVDDTAILVRHTNPETAVKLLQEHVTKIEKWLQEKQTKANPTKCNHISFTLRKKIPPNILLSGTHITQTQHVKYLFFYVEEIRADTRPLLGEGVVPDSNRLKPPRWPTRLRSKEAREPLQETHQAPPAHKIHRLRSRRTRQSGSPTGLPGGPEALIYRHLTLTPTGGSGGPGAPCPSVSAASAAPPPIDPLGVGTPHPHSFPLPPSEA